MAQPIVEFDDAWESIPLEYVDDVLAYFDQVLQPTCPLRAFKLLRVAECWRKEKYLVEEEQPSDLLWILDMEKKIRIGGKTCFYLKRVETQEELDAMVQADRCAPRPAFSSAESGHIVPSEAPQTGIWEG